MSIGNHQHQSDYPTCVFLTLIIFARRKAWVGLPLLWYNEIMKNFALFFFLTLLLSGCSLCRLPCQTVKTAGIVVRTTGRVAESAGKAAAAGTQAAGKVAEAGGKTAEAALKTPGAREAIIKKVIP